MIRVFQERRRRRKLLNWERNKRMAAGRDKTAGYI